MSRAKPKSAENLTAIEAIRTRLGMTQREFSLALGFTTETGYASVLHAGEATTTLYLAAQALDRTPTQQRFLLTIADGVVQTLEPLPPGLDTITIAGQTHLLLPINQERRPNDHS